MTATLSPANTLTGAVNPIMVTELTEEREAFASTHDVIDAALPTITYVGPMRKTGTLSLVMASRADALAALALLEAPVRIQDNACTPSLDMKCAANRAQLVRSDAHPWVVTLDYTAVVA